MFRAREKLPAPGIAERLPDLIAYVRERYKPEKKKVRTPGPASGKTGYGIAEPEKTIEQEPSGEGVRYSLSSDLQEEIEMRSLLRRSGKDLALLDSPAVKKYYRSWERKNSVRKTFSSEVMRMVRSKFRKASSFYNPVGIDKRTFHRMKTDYEYKPSKNTAFRCCIALHLNGEQADELLKLAGYAFSPSDPSDLVIRFCLDNGIWDLPSINYLMDSFELKDLEGYKPP